MIKKMDNKLKIKLIKIYQVGVQDLEKAQDKLFKKACKHLKIQRHSKQGEVLFDALYNAFWTPSQAVEHIWTEGMNASKRNT